MITDHKKIAIRYFYSGNMVIDFLATFPFEYIKVADDKTWLNSVFKMLRLTRLKRVMSLFDLSKINRILKSLFESSQR